MDKKFTENIKKRLDKLAGYAILILIFILSLSVIRNIGNQARIKAEVDAEKAKVAKMQEDNAKLQEEILQTQGGDFIDKEIRNKLGLVKSGEVIVVLPDDDTLRKLAPGGQSVEDSLPDPNYRKWLKLFL